MKSIVRNAIVFLSGFALSLFALAGSAAGPTKQFSINVTKGAIVAPGISEFWLEIRNETPNGNSTINSMKVPLPGSFKIVSDPTHYAAFTTPSSGQVVAPNDATVISISNLYPLKPQQTLTLKFWADTGTSASCVPLSWTAQAWTGSNFSGDTFIQLTPAQVLAATNPPRTIVSSTTIATDAALQFGSITSVVAGQAFSVTVNQTSSCGTSVTLPPVSVTLSGTPDFTLGTKTQSGASTKFSGNVFGTVGTGTLTASAPGYASAVITLKIFDGTLACKTSTNFNALDLPSTGTGSFDASEGGASAVGDTGFVAGVRGTGDPEKDDCSQEINYALYNNIPTSYNTNLTDPAGNLVYPGFYSFSWDTNIAPNPVVAVIATFRPEWGDPTTGLPTHKTLICTNVPCLTPPYVYPGGVETINTAGGWKAAVACLSTIVTHSSVPAGEIGCVASEKWDVVPKLIPDPDNPANLIANPDFCAGTAPKKPDDSPGVGVCLLPTSIMIMGQDPVFGR